MVGCLVSTMLINSENRRPNVIVASGKMREKFYSPDSNEVKNVPLMLKSLSFFTLICYILAFMFIKDKPKEENAEE
jgi:hypothetical protein